MSSSPSAKIVVSSAHIATTVRVVSCCTWMRSMCMPLMVCLSMHGNGSMASAKRRDTSGHPCPTPCSLLNGSDPGCYPMTHSVKPLAVDISLCTPMPLHPKCVIHHHKHTHSHKAILESQLIDVCISKCALFAVCHPHCLLLDRSVCGDCHSFTGECV